MGDGNELHIEWPNASTLIVDNGDQFGFAKQPSFFNAMSRQTKRDFGAVNRKRHIAQQELQAAYVILVPMSRDAGLDAVGVFAQPCEVGKHQVDAVHVGVGKHEPAVDEQQAIVLLDDHAVAADFAEATEENNANWRCH